MKHRSLLLFLLVIPFPTLAQLPGKTYFIRPEGARRSYVYFYNDSLLTFAKDAGDSLVSETFLYEIDDEGTLHYCIPKQQPDPVVRTYRSEKPPLEQSSSDPARLFLINSFSPAFSMNGRWELYLDGQLITYGGEFERLYLQNLNLPGVSFSLRGFNCFYRKNHLFSVSDFSGAGDYFVIETTFPHLFFHVNVVFHPGDLQHTVPLQLREGKLLNPLTQERWEEY